MTLRTANRPEDAIRVANRHPHPHTPRSAPLLPAALLAAAFLTVPTSGAPPEAPSEAPSAAADGGLFAPVLDGLGDHHHEISTDVPRAQSFFDQGLTLAWGFNHAEAERSFRQAAALDPECAMCWWGVAWVLGPNINAAMEPAAVPEAWEALQEAQARKEHATARERAYVDALAARYAAPDEVPEDRSSLDSAFADATRNLAERYPDDLDAATLHAEALMDTTPWHYWREGGKPKAVTREILGTLERVLEREPDHVGANHLYIHAVEAVHPERGVPAAERLEGLAPGAGHLVHMPSHVYIRVGRYHDSVAANRRAVAADDAYVAQCYAQGLYPLAYVPHNHNFLWASAAFSGEKEAALEAAREVAAGADPTMLREPGFGALQHFRATPLYALVRFGEWRAVLDEPAPAEDLRYPRGVWRWARGMALTRLERLDEADDELARLTEIAADERLEEVTIWQINTTRSLLEIAREMLAGELAAARGDHAEAVRHLRAGVELEDGLAYYEPPPWPLPTRQYLGAALLEVGEPGEAEEVFRADLEKYPANGWSLFGLSRALEAQGEEAAAERALERFRRAWRHADVELDAARM